MKRINWVASRWAKILGIPGMSGLALLVSALIFHLGFSLPAASRLANLTQQVAQAKADRGKHEVREDERTPEFALSKFYSTFPREKEIPQLLGKIYSAARSESVQLERGEYKYIPEKSGKLAMYQISFPLKGEYVAIRKFVVDVLNALPSAALDDASFRRESVESQLLDAKIRFTIYLGEH